MNWVERDRLHVWHPYTQMQTAQPPLPIVSAAGSKLFLEDGAVLIDAISSWWVITHGHCHPYLAEQVSKQLSTLDQVIFAGATHPQAVILAERLTAHLGHGLSRTFFSDNGSTAVEVALKMAWQYWQNKGQSRHRIVALEGAYHGDTFGAMSASGRSIFTRAFEDLLFSVDFLPDLNDNLELAVERFKALVKGGDVACLIVEPLVQGAAGMQMYPAAHLDRITKIAREAGVLVIFDEVMTGFYRTGTMFAMEQCQLKPDIICLAKGLTGGLMPMAITACTEDIFNAFLSQDRAKMLFHGHSFTANGIGCAAANASLDLYEAADFPAKVQSVCDFMRSLADEIRPFPQTKHVRTCGTILAFEIEAETHGYLSDASQNLKASMLEAGVWIRPLGDTVYLLPPYCLDHDEMQTIRQALLQGLKS